MTPVDSSPTPRRAFWPLVVCMLALPFFLRAIGSRHAPPIFCNERVEPAAATVVMLSASWCGYCARARDFFTQKRIAYCEYDIEKSAVGAARHRASGARGVPVIVIDGHAQIGFSRTDIEEALSARGKKISLRHRDVL
jgi:glutaredoxin